MSLNPYMMILSADPAKYLKTPAATLLALLRAVEGVFAVEVFLHVLHFVRGILGGEDCAYAIRSLLRPLLPAELLAAYPLLGGRAGTIACAATAILVLVGLAAMIAESCALLLLRFAEKASGLIKRLHRIIWLDALAVVAALAAVWALQIAECLSAGMRPGPPFFLMIAAAAVSLLLAGLYARYHDGVCAVLDAVAYELALGFKEVSVDAKQFPLIALLFEALFIAAAAALGLRGEYLSGRFFVCVFMALKFFAVRRCWGAFHRCHR